MSSEPDDTPRHIGWLRAILTAVAITVVGIGVTVYGTNAVLTKMGGDRSSRVRIATILFFVALFAIAWTLRWLQRRKLI